LDNDDIEWLLYIHVFQVRLRSILDQMLQVSAHDMQRQVDTTNDALDTRIHETRSTKEKLEDHLRLIKNQIIQMEDNIDRLIIAIEEKMPPLRLSHTRLAHRTTRPDIELTRDAVQYRLVEEVQINAEMVATLNERLNHSRCSLSGLDRKRLELEEDIAIKTATLFIDEVECMGMRKSIRVNCY